MRAPTRSEPRDTSEVLEALGLPPAALAKELRRATPGWIEALKLAPILLTLIGGFSAVAVRWDRAATKDDLAAAVDRLTAATEQRLHAIEAELAGLEKQNIELRLSLGSISAEAERRLSVLERKRGRQ